LEHEREIGGVGRRRVCGERIAGCLIRVGSWRLFPVEGVELMERIFGGYEDIGI